jgi:hypothetical protein
LQRAAARGGIAILPPDVRAALELGPEWDITPGQDRALRWAGWLAEKVVMPGSPPAQAAKRLGLPIGTAWARPSTS